MPHSLARFYIKIDLTHRTATRTLESSAISMLYYKRTDIQVFKRCVLSEIYEKSSTRLGRIISFDSFYVTSMCFLVERARIKRGDRENSAFFWNNGQNCDRKLRSDISHNARKSLYYVYVGPRTRWIVNSKSKVMNIFVQESQAWTKILITF